MTYKLIGVIVLITILLTLPLSARNAPYTTGKGIFSWKFNNRVGGDAPTTDYQYHDVGNIWLTVTNWGFVGNPDKNSMPYYPSCEYPANSDLEYLFQSGLWIGSIVKEAASKRETLVSTGLDGWLNSSNSDYQEFYPGTDPGDTIKIKSTRQSSEFYDSTAISEQDFIAEYFDDQDISGAEHQPQGVKVIQSSYAWSYSFNDDFVLVHFEIMNEGFQDGSSFVLTKGWLGLYVDADTGPNWNTNYNGPAQDDVAGFWQEEYNDAYGNKKVLKLGLIQDADPGGGANDPNWPKGYWEYTGESQYNDGWHTTTLISAFVVGNPLEEKNKGNGTVGLKGDSLVTCWNWWISDSSGAANNDESPMGDGEKYRRLSNGQNDFFDEGSKTEEGKEKWSNEKQMVPDDTRFLISYGEFNDIKKGDKLAITVAVICGLNRLHLVENAKWAKDIYDNNYIGPQPPKAPGLALNGGNKKVEIFWDNSSESSKDPITNIADFKGYRVWRSRTGLLTDFQLLATYQMEMNTEYTYQNKKNKGKWGTNKPPMKDGKYYLVDQPVLNGFQYYYSVTAYDWGYGDENLGENQSVDPLECSVTENATAVVPGNEHTTAIEDVYVFPNPYRADLKYRNDGFEAEYTEYGRRVVFCNLPKKCIIRIFTLSGELIRKIKHDEVLAKNTVAQWDLMNMNKIAVSSGIYLWAVESLSSDTPGKKVGKIVIIR
ncbi:MAG: hypothetical protein JXA60_00365 [Candidatus Coatesbacteria bacterium]|nr:hypothetical protein [Candidatus Coatesbacteria bacterium]